ncbi:MAG: ParB/RepB/Spo0J family partition protein [Methylophilaceae bacterium]|nr:ParB/RepB/Spo0J family partition protein [Methylophilaceae bacterium]
MATQKGLGRGLDALLGGDLDAVARNDVLRTLKVGQLQPGKYQPRTQMDQESLQQLAESIKARGVMSPILVRPIDQDQYEIVAGERRWRAAQLAGMDTIPALVREIADEAALAMSLIENIQRENLNPLEEAAGIKRLIDEFNMTHQMAADSIGRSRTAVTNLLRLLNLAMPVQELLMQGHIDMGHARALLSLEGAKQIAIAQQIAQKKLSVREAERLVHAMLRPRKKAVIEPDRDILRLQEEIADHLAAKVTIRHTHKGAGKLVVEFNSLDELEGILARMGLAEVSG